MSSFRDQLAFLWEHLRPQARGLVLLALAVAGGSAAALAGPILLARYIDAAEGGRSVALTAALYLVTACALPALAVAESWVATLVAWRSTNPLRSLLFQHCLQQDLDLVERHPPGTLISRIDGDVDLLSEFLSTFLARLGSGVLVIAGVLVVLATIDWRLSALLAFFLVLCAVALNAPGRPAQRRWLENRQATGEEFGTLEELLSGIEDIRANGATGWALDAYSRRGQVSNRTFRSAQLWSSSGWGSALVLYGWATSACLALATWLHGQHALTLGTVYLVFSYADAIRDPLNAVNRQLQLLQTVGAALTRMRQLTSERSRLAWAQETVPVAGPAPAVGFDGVDFSYPNGGEALRAVSFELSSGRRLGIVGRTGSGKTTIARLLLRFQDPTAGEVQLGGIDLRRLPQAELRRLVAYVPQDVQLLHGTVRDNLTLFDPSVPDERLLEVLRALELEDWLRSLPAGLATVLAAGARDLSAGQAQLLAAARAFLTDPGLVVLDEASSKIDPVTERRLEAALDHLLAGRTACIIAHRLTTLRNVDDILVMNAGQVLEFGPREALEQDPASLYAGLLRHGLPEAIA